MTVTLLTAVYDNYDSLREICVQDIPHEAICVTDNPNLASETWNVIYEPRPDRHPNLAAKSPKMCPWRYTDADLTIWLDASFEIISYDFLAAVSKFAPLGQFSHPDRACIYAEGNYSTGLRKYSDLPLEAQMADYRNRGHPEHWGLWATGVIVRQHTPEIEAFGEAWLAECEKWSFQDQVSEAVILREHGLRPTAMPGSYNQNPWVQYAGSGRH